MDFEGAVNDGLVEGAASNELIEGAASSVLVEGAVDDGIVEGTADGLVEGEADGGLVDGVVSDGLIGEWEAVCGALSTILADKVMREPLHCRDFLVRAVWVVLSAASRSRELLVVGSSEG
jgi:hypothetical protein